MKKIGVLMGSSSDWEKVKPALDLLDELGIPVVAHIYSAHRTPGQVVEFAQNAEADGFGVILAAAGMAAHLAGVVASATTLQVIGIPLKSAALDGLDALLSTVQMPRGIPVATVAVDGAYNAALLAAQIISLGDEDLRKKLRTLRWQMARDVLAKDGELGRTRGQ